MEVEVIERFNPTVRITLKGDEAEALCLIAEHAHLVAETAHGESTAQGVIPVLGVTEVGDTLAALNSILVNRGVEVRAEIDPE